ncbi:hypothetical protein PHAMO_210378 [Magnetospirillum molischianum DSM 120]|uniref:Uncharacterized protein n=1 Tax=Magnetospirillum molischianum DSM 120 TaxID=1150626 RepID=H8FR79_MAGML|nr:hypothetical protein PHAMO_210378 [Magnetospirillum molischianum DSM 120]
MAIILKQGTCELSEGKPTPGDSALATFRAAILVSDRAYGYRRGSARFIRRRPPTHRGHG